MSRPSPWRRVASLAAFLVAVNAAMADAQIPSLADIFSKIEDVNTGLGVARLITPGDLNGDQMRSIIFEVTFVAKAARPPTPAGPPYTVVEKVVTTTGNDSTVEVHSVPAKPPAPASTTQIEVGLSYGQLTGFASDVAGLQITGTLEEFPVIAAYVSFAEDEAWEPYLAARAGITKLSAFRGYGAGDSLYTASGTTYMVGFGGGIARVLVGGTYLYLEGMADYRKFPSVEWNAVSGTVPANLPRTLRVSTVQLTIGVQIGVK